MFSKKSLGLNSKRKATVRGLPSLGSASISGRLTEMEVRDSAKICESCGWMNWSISGGQVSRTMGQKLGMEEVISERLA